MSQALTCDRCWQAAKYLPRPIHFLFICLLQELPPLSSSYFSDCHKNPNVSKDNPNYIFLKSFKIVKKNPKYTSQTVMMADLMFLVFPVNMCLLLKAL